MNKKKQIVSERQDQSTRWKKELEKTGGPKYSCMHECNRQNRMSLRQLVSSGKLTTRSDELETVKYQPRWCKETKVWAPNRGFWLDVSMQTSMSEIQQETGKKTKGLCLLSFSHLDMLLLFALLRRLSHISYSFFFCRQLPTCYRINKHLDS